MNIKLEGTDYTKHALNILKFHASRWLCLFHLFYSRCFFSFVDSLRLRCVSSIQSEESISHQNSIDNPPLALEHHRFSSLVLTVNVERRQKWKEWEEERKCERANENWQVHVFVVILMSLICSLLSSLIDQKEITTFRGVNSWNFLPPTFAWHGWEPDTTWRGRTAPRASQKLYEAAHAVDLVQMCPEFVCP